MKSLPESPGVTGIRKKNMASLDVTGYLFARFKANNEHGGISIFINTDIHTSIVRKFMFFLNGNVET